MTSNSKETQLNQLYDDVLALRDQVYDEGQSLFQSWDPDTMREDFRNSALNFAYYVALRKQDIRELQIRLSNWGLSSLGRLENNVLTTLNLVLANLGLMTKNDKSDHEAPQDFFADAGQTELDNLAQQFLGNKPDHRYSRIMVTMPTEAADDYDLVNDMVKEGMNVARINCAHDNVDVWQKMIENIQKAATENKTDVKIFTDIAGPKVRIDAIYTTLKNPRLNKNDSFFLTFKAELKSFYDQDIVITSDNEDLITSLEKGEAVSLDDGEVLGEVAEVQDEGVIIHVSQVQKSNGKKIKATKGINFPDRKLDLPVITEKDRQDLSFAKDNADVIGFSFINKVDDIFTIQEELSQTMGEEADNKQLVLKIETVGGFQNLVKLIVEANRKNPTGIMIARGDLAVETGYLRLSVIQEEILWLCEAAQIPVIWATQVLESLVKSGVPSRSEISDVTLGSRAECVMLNKGPHIIEGIALLRDILEDIDEHQYKKTPLMKRLNVAQQAFD